MKLTGNQGLKTYLNLLAYLNSIFLFLQPPVKREIHPLLTPKLIKACTGL